LDWVLLEKKQIEKAKMEKEKLNKANEIQNRINAIDSILKRVDNKEGYYKVMFGVSINEFTGPFMPIMFEEDLNKELSEITKKYCTENLVELQKEFDNL
jgi:hypothetical protein